MTGTPAPAERPGAARRWWQDGMAWLVIGIIALVVGGNAVMIWIAVDAEPSLVRPDYYAASKQVDDERAARLASAALGWQVGLVEAAAPDGVHLRITDAAGAPVAGLAGSVRAYRPSDAALDQPLTWQADAATPGTYRAIFPRPVPGRWRLTLDLRQGGRRLYEDVTVVLPTP